jgi:nicotinamidase-related amidase
MKMRFSMRILPALAGLMFLSLSVFGQGSATAGAAAPKSKAKGDQATALLLIDLQNDYFPSGRMELVGADASVAKARLLLEHFRKAGMPVIHVRHEETEAEATFFRAGTPGAEIHEAVKPLPGEVVITKHFPNAFLQTPLAERLKALGIKRLVIAGMMTHMCVDASVRAAADQDFECLLASDGCATRDLKWGTDKIPAASVQAAFLAALRGAYARVLPAQEILGLLGI